MILKQKNYYEILDVNPNVTDDEIRRAFYALAKKYRPDATKNSDDDEHFKKLLHAYETLRNSQSRKIYDKFMDYWLEHQYEQRSEYDKIKIDNILTQVDEIIDEKLDKVCKSLSENEINFKHNKIKKVKHEFSNRIDSLLSNLIAGRQLDWNYLSQIIMKIFSTMGKEKSAEKDIEKAMKEIRKNLEEPQDLNTEIDVPLQEITYQDDSLMNQDPNSLSNSSNSQESSQQPLFVPNTQSVKRELMSVAPDGNCLINSLILSYLEKEKNNKDNFILKAKKLFPKLPHDIKNYEELFTNFKTLQKNNSKLKSLGLILRQQIADHINKTIDASHFPKKDESDIRSPELIKKDYIEKLKQNGTWCDEREIKAFCDLFDCTISVEREDNNKKYTFHFGEKKESTTDSLLELHFISNHYSYFEKELNHFNNPNYEKEPNNIDPFPLELSTSIFLEKEGQDRNFMLSSTSNGTNQSTLDNHRKGASSSSETLSSFRKQQRQAINQIEEIQRLKKGKQIFDSVEQILELI